MDKPEIKRYNAKVGFMGGEKVFSMNEQNFGPWVAYGDHVAAILSAQSQAYIDAARIAEDWEPVEKLLPFADDSHNEAAHTGQYEAGERISAAILQRKEEMGR